MISIKFFTSFKLFNDKSLEQLELKAGGKSLAKVKIQRDVFRGDTLSPLLFVIAMMPFNHILRKCTGEYKLSKLHEAINHLMYMDDINQFAKNEKKVGNIQ